VRKETVTRAGLRIVSRLHARVQTTLDNNRNPTNGLLVEFQAGRCRCRRAMCGFSNPPSTPDSTMRIFPDVVGLVRAQGGYATGWGGEGLRMLDHFQGGPNMVRGFAPAGFGPRDITQSAQLCPGGGVCGTNDALGGSLLLGGHGGIPDADVLLPRRISA